MKNKNSTIAIPILVSVILFLIPLSEKLLILTAVNDSNVLLSASVVQLFIFAIPTAFYCKITGVSFLGYSKIRKVSLNCIPFVISAAFTYFFAAIIMMYIEHNIFSGAVGSDITYASIESGLMEVLLTYVLIPAFAEEMFFRSIILSDYSEFKGPCAVIMSALFFAMLHFSFERFITYFVLGILLATVTYVTDSSFPSVIIHLVYNCSVIFFGDIANVFLRESSSSVILAFILVLLFMASLTAMLSAMEGIYERRSDLYESGELPGSRKDSLSNMSRAGKVDKKEEKSVYKTSSLFLSPTFFVSVALFVLITLDII